MTGNIDEALYIREKTRTHNEWFKYSIPMIASENLMSPLAKEVYMSDLMDRYAEGLPHERYYEGNIYVDMIEDKVVELGKKIFKAELVDPRPISGTVANLAALFALTKPGDIIMSPALSDGAHISTAKFGAVGVRGVNNVNYIFDPEIMNIDVDATAKLIRQVKPKVCLFGRSVFLFPSPIKDLMDAIQEVKARVWYDAAHVLGLIAGGQFQDPLREGVEIMTGSTHKTLPGPQHGIIIANPLDEKKYKKIQSSVFPGVVSNHHLHAMAALGITLAEHLEFGEAYAKQIIANAQKLGEELYNRGFKVLAADLGFTKSHTLLIDMSEYGGGAPVSKLLEKANIIANKNLIPGDKSPITPSGIRLGVQEITRLGMKEDEMIEIAEFFKRLIIDKEEPAKVKEDVIEFKKDYQTIHYCFGKKEGTAYEYLEMVKI